MKEIICDESEMSNKQNPDKIEEIKEVSAKEEISTKPDEIHIKKDEIIKESELTPNKSAEEEKKLHKCKKCQYSSKYPRFLSVHEKNCTGWN